MIIFGQWLLRVLALFLGAILDRVIGLPILTIVLVSIFSRYHQGWWQYGLLIIASLLLAILFMLPVALVLLMIWGVYFWAKYGQKIVFSRRLRMITAVIIGVVIFWAGSNFL